MNLFEPFISLITDPKRKMSHKTAVVISFVLITIFLDNYLGISFHFKITNQIEELKQADAIIKNPLSDSITKSYAQVLRNRIMNHKSIVDYFSRNASLNSKRANTNNPAQIPIINEPIKNDFWFFISAGGLFYFTGVVLALGMFLWSNDEVGLSGFWDKFATGSVFLILFIAFGYCISTIAYHIPMIGKNWTINYWVNVLIQIIGLFIVMLGLSFSYNQAHARFRKDLLKKLEQKEPKEQ